MADKPNVTEMGRRRAAKLLSPGRLLVLNVVELAKVLADFGDHVLLEARAAADPARSDTALPATTCDPACGAYVGDPERNNRRFFSPECLRAGYCISQSSPLIATTEKIRKLAASLVSDLYAHEAEVQRLRDQLASGKAL